MSLETDQAELKALILENRRLLEENTHILKRMRTVAVWDFGIRMLITAIILGLPLVAYFYVIEEYSESLGKFFHAIQELSKDQGFGSMLIRHDNEFGN